MSTAPGIIRACTLVTYELDHMNRVYSPEGVAPTIHTCGGGNTEPKVLIEGGQRMNPAEQYFEIPTWPAYNNQNRVYLGGGICPTLTTQCSHSKPPLILIGGTE